MGKRGRKSRAELTVVGGAKKDGVEVVERPAPPSELTPEQSDIWQDVVESLAADYFTEETFPILTQYCRHVSRARHFSYLVNKMESQKKLDKDEIKVYRDLCRSEEEQTRAIASLATKMRLTHLATYDRRKAKNRNEGDEPWND
ncbi:hypothetical protein GWO43_15950 [candidate division KSB1 bacterium]|nr:hypothetical protein [candidate division KSB1 bacterium]NIV68724.1 hypothetical protein [Phycisphaerae bacterium]NIS25444.1 hypothetical protein [candidate division KSB1 bacterium]NIT72336.1 hypothetical protein [candidate division KSB1 bacterium]NIU26121.1 hypothetical protein [candidate division KSB1 bacterium]